jgi:hypothetical protein
MEINLRQLDCCHERCGITWWVAKGYYDELVDKKHLFYCPNGHSQQFTRNEKDRLNEMIAKQTSEIFDLKTQLAAKCNKPRRTRKKVR